MSSLPIYEKFSFIVKVLSNLNFSSFFGMLPVLPYYSADAKFLSDSPCSVTIQLAPENHKSTLDLLHPC